MTTKSGRTVWTVAIGLQWAAAIALLLLDLSTPNKVLAFAAFAIVVNGFAYMLARNSGVRPPWEALLSAVFKEQNGDLAEEMGLGWAAVAAQAFPAPPQHFKHVSP